MIQPNTLKTLQSYNGSLFPILSVYLGSDTLQAPTREYLLTQLHSLTHNLTADQKTMFKRDIKKIEEYINSYTPSYRGLVFFSAGNKLWQALNLEFYMPASLTVDNSPNTEALAKSLHSHSKYLVLLVDREKAKMFTVEQGEIAEQAEYIGDTVSRPAKASSRDGTDTQPDINSRRSDMLLKQHIVEVTKAVTKFVKAADISFVIVGGHNEMFKKVAEALPANLRSKTVLGLVTDINQPLSTILRESKKLAASVK